MITIEHPSAIIQARTGSTRLPGKIAMIIENKPVLIHFLDRINRMEFLDKIIIVTTEKESDNVIIEMVQKYYGNLEIYRGSESDVLDRFYQAAKKYNINHIIRMTPDCPLIDSHVSDAVIRAYMENDCTYCSNTMPRSYPHGLDTEVFSFNALERAWNEAKEQREREHVTPYLRENPEAFRQMNVQNDTDLSKMRWTLDYPEDFEFMKAVYSRLYKKNEVFSMNDVLTLLKDEPHIADINKNRAMV